jgi:hypothetical protein
VRFTRASLTVRHQNTIESIQYVLSDRSCNRIISLVLRFLLIEDTVKNEISLVGIRLYKRQGLHVKTTSDARDTPFLFCLFVCEEWPQSNNNYAEVNMIVEAYL